MMANLENLKTHWQTQRGISPQQFDEIGTKVKSSTQLLQSTISRRDLVETAAAVIVVAGFAPGLFIANNWVAWSGFLIEVIAGSTIPFVLWWARKRSVTNVSAANFRDFIDVEVDYLRRQVRLLAMIGWWYLLPIYIGIVLIIAGLSDPRSWQLFMIFATVFLSISSAFFIFVWRLNQKARKNHFEPLLRYYQEMQVALESGDDFDSPLLDPPSAFLQSQTRRPLTKRGRWMWFVMTVILTASVAAAGYAIMQEFDARTGKFVLSTSPLFALIMIVVSGAWRRDRVSSPTNEQTEQSL